MPGGALACDRGVTVVGVLPTHRRRGMLRRDDATRSSRDVHERGEPIAALWASEETIYGRFGYGLAALAGDIELPKEHARPWHDEPLGQARLLDPDERVEVSRAIYDRVQAETPGMFTRTRDWWQVRRLRQRPGKPPAQRGRDRARRRRAGLRALPPRVRDAPHDHARRKLEVSEALGTSPEALDAVWRYLLAIDWVARIDAYWLPLDHPLFHWIREPRRMACHVFDGLWVRLVDVEAALAARSLGDGLARARGARRALSLEPGALAGRGRLGLAARPQPADLRARRRRARLGLPGRLHLRGPRAGGPGRGAAARRDRPRRRDLRHRAPALVPRALLAERFDPVEPPPAERAGVRGSDVDHGVPLVVDRAQRRRPEREGRAAAARVPAARVVA